MEAWDSSRASWGKNAGCAAASTTLASAPCMSRTRVQLQTDTRNKCVMGCFSSLEYKPSLLDGHALARNDFPHRMRQATYYGLQTKRHQAIGGLNACAEITPQSLSRRKVSTGGLRP